MSRLGLPKDAPPLPEGYHYIHRVNHELNMARVEVGYKGARIFIIHIELFSDVNYWNKQKRYAARPVRDPARGPFTRPAVLQWIEYPDLETLVTSMITKHRLGAI